MEFVRGQKKGEENRGEVAGNDRIWLFLERANVRPRASMTSGTEGRKATARSCHTRDETLREHANACGTANPSGNRRNRHHVATIVRMVMLLYTREPRDALLSRE